MSPHALANPKHSVVIILGASSFGRAPSLNGGPAFLNSASRFLAYLTGDHGLGIDRRNVLQLFDDYRSASDQLEEVSHFLSSSQAPGRPDPPENVFVYYVGHGLFTSDRKYCLAVRSTSDANPGISSIRGRDLAQIITDNAIYLRRFLILDCCFAASLYREFLAAPVEAVSTQILDELPERGTSLLCASSSQDVALAPDDLDQTMFTDALLKALSNGNPTLGPRLSLGELGTITRTILKQEYPSTWVRPEIHSPDMRVGDISSLPLFPNPAFLSPALPHEESIQAPLVALPHPIELPLGGDFAPAAIEATPEPSANRGVAPIVRAGITDHAAAPVSPIALHPDEGLVVSRKGGNKNILRMSLITAGLLLCVACVLWLYHTLKGSPSPVPVPAAPTISCSANPAMINMDEVSTITSTVSNPQNRPLTFSYSASAGTINGSGTTTYFSSTGAPSGTVGITCNLSDDKGHLASARTNVTIRPPLAAPAANLGHAPAAHQQPTFQIPSDCVFAQAPARNVCNISFDSDHLRPTRVDGAAKACLDEVALNLRMSPGEKVAIFGLADPTETTPGLLAAQRAVNARQYLTREKGVDPDRIILRIGSTSGKLAQNFLLPPSGTYDLTCGIFDETKIPSPAPAPDE